MGRLTEKGRGIQTMFEGIAPRYDLLNRMLSLGIDRRWRRRAVGCLDLSAGRRFLDLATGTGDVALEIASRTAPSAQVFGEDFTQGMLVHGQRKLVASPFAGRIFLVNASAEAIPHRDRLFDGVTIAFGIRNVVDRQQGLREMFRVLRPGGRVVILEFSHPRNRLFKSLYYLYFRRILPAIGGLFSRRSAYQYLPDSVLEFPGTEEFCRMLEEVGFKAVQATPLTGGIATIFVGTRS